MGLCYVVGHCTDVDSKRGRCRLSPLGVGGIKECESEAAFADSVSHTILSCYWALLRLLCRRRGAIEHQQGFCAGLTVQ